FFGLEKNRARARARHPMDFAIVSRRDKKIAPAVERERPNIFLVRIVEDRGFPVIADLIYFAVWIRSSIDLIARIDRDGVDFQALQLREGPALAGWIDHEQFRRSAA